VWQKSTICLTAGLKANGYQIVCNELVGLVAKKEQEACFMGGFEPML
jgi:hypothetical protein